MRPHTFRWRGVYERTRALSASVKSRCVRMPRRILDRSKRSGPSYCIDVTAMLVTVSVARKIVLIKRMLLSSLCPSTAGTGHLTADVALTRGTGKDAASAGEQEAPQPRISGKVAFMLGRPNARLLFFQGHGIRASASGCTENTTRAHNTDLRFVLGIFRGVRDTVHVNTSVAGKRELFCRRQKIIIPLSLELDKSTEERSVPHTRERGVVHQILLKCEATATILSDKAHSQHFLFFTLSTTVYDCQHGDGLSQP